VATNVHPEGGLGEAHLGAGAHAAPVLQVQVQGLDMILQVVFEFEIFAAGDAGPRDNTLAVNILVHLSTYEVSVL
jgi:hypothetical protein